MKTVIQNPFDLLDKRLQSIEETLSAMVSKENPKSDDKLYYSAREAAEKLQVSEITIYRQMQSGKIPSKRVGSRRVIPASFIANHNQ